MTNHNKIDASDEGVLRLPIRELTPLRDVSGFSSFVFCHVLVSWRVFGVAYPER